MTGRDPVHLICSIGPDLNRYQETLYRLGEETYSTRFAPVAVARALDLHGKASVLVTDQARCSYEQLAIKLRDAGLKTRDVPMPEGRTEGDILDAFCRLVQEIQQGEHVVLDVTFSLRHLPFVYLAALTYLTAHRRVTIKGIYYGAWELRAPGADGLIEAPILDVTPLFRLMQWYHAIQTAQESGDVRAVARMLEGDVGALFRRKQGDKALSAASKTLKRLAPALAAGLPLEVGIESRGLATNLARLGQPGTTSQVARLSLEIFPTWLERWATPAGTERKASLRLSETELRRQLRLAEWYADRGDLHKTLLILREWLVSLFVLRRGEPGRWLERKHREGIVGYIGSLSWRAQHELATGAEAEVAGIWDEAGKLRNQFAHAGIIQERVKVQERRQKVQALLARAGGLLGDEAIGRLPQIHAGGGLLLVTPAGLSPGALYSALRRLQPDQMIVITSVEARQRLSETLEAAESANTPTLELELTEPLTGFREAQALINQEGVRRWLAGAGEVVANLTGGSTVMGYIVERVAEEASSLGVPVRRVALVDRRPFEQQRSDPFVLGELIYLDDVKERDVEGID